MENVWIMWKKFDWGRGISGNPPSPIGFYPRNVDKPCGKDVDRVWITRGKKKGEKNLNIRVDIWFFA